jgi:DNA-binding GntR family transcriptional regulator
VTIDSLPCAEPVGAITDPPEPSEQRARGRDNTLTIHRVIRDEILAGQLPAETWISQVQIAKRFGVSRGPVREALRLLEREGLIEATLNQRARVTPVSVDDLEQLYAARIIHEGLGIAISVPRFSPDEIHGLWRRLDELDSLAGGDIARWEEAHRDFHTELVKYAGQRFVAMLRELYDHAERYRRLYITGDPRAWSFGAAEHREIVEACAANDPALAAARLGRHLARTALTAVSLMAPEHEPASVRAAVRQLSAAANSVDTSRTTPINRRAS